MGGVPPINRPSVYYLYLFKLHDKLGLNVSCLNIEVLND